MSGQIIVLNGVSSSGKTTLAYQLQQILPEPYYVIQQDAFEDMIPKQLLNSSAAQRQKALQLCLDSLLFCIRAYYKEGHSLIVDLVFRADGGFENWQQQFFNSMQNYPLKTIGVHCSPVELERRELKRGNRPAGHARSQLPFVHKNISYALEVDTSQNTIVECADKIRKLLDIDR